MEKHRKSVCIVVVVFVCIILLPTKIPSCSQLRGPFANARKRVTLCPRASVSLSRVPLPQISLSATNYHFPLTMSLSTARPALDTTAAQCINVLLHTLSQLHAGTKMILETETWRKDLDSLMVRGKVFANDCVY